MIRRVTTRMQTKSQEPGVPMSIVASATAFARRPQTTTMVLADMLTLAYVLTQKYQQSSRQECKAAAAHGDGYRGQRYLCPPHTGSCSSSRVDVFMCMCWVVSRFHVHVRCNGREAKCDQSNLDWICRKLQECQAATLRTKQVPSPPR